MVEFSRFPKKGISSGHGGKEHYKVFDWAFCGILFINMSYNAISKKIYFYKLHTIFTLQ